MAVQQGTCDVAFTGGRTRRGFQPVAHGEQEHGQEGRLQDRVPVREDPGFAYAYLTSLPADLKAAIRTAFFDAPKNDKAAFDRLSDGKSPGFAPAQHSDYQVTIELQRFVDNLRKKSGS